MFLKIVAINSKKFDVFNIIIKGFYVCINFEFAIYDEKKIVTTRIR